MSLVQAQTAQTGGGSTSARPLVPLHDTPLAQMSPQAFAAAAIVLGVQQRDMPAGMSGMSELVVAPDDDQQRAYDHLLQTLDDTCAQLRPGDPAQSRSQADRLLRAAMSIDLAQGVVCLQLPGGTPLVIVRIDLLREHGVDAVVRQAHGAQVLRAQSQGLAVHEACLDAYGLHSIPGAAHREQRGAQSQFSPAAAGA